jgi:nicotinic acid phosphoribosyltransferase
VPQALRAAEKVFGADINGKGYKVVRGCGVIQGDGIGIKTLRRIAEAVQAAGFSGECVAFGMGGGLLQKVNRDTMSFATKLNHIVYADGTPADIMKQPSTDSGKFSLPGAAPQRMQGISVHYTSDPMAVLGPGTDVPHI